MRKAMRWAIAASMVLLAACVTINVYFPAAAAEKAAEEFVGKVIGEGVPAAPVPKAEERKDAPRPRPLSLLGLVIADAVAAEADIHIATPAIQALQARMAERFKTLKSHFDNGALGFTHTGLIELRDASAVSLAERAAVKQTIADDNRDRDALYREIAVANGHPEWEADIRATFARQWIASAHSGWFYQDQGGAWQRK